MQAEWNRYEKIYGISYIFPLLIIKYIDYFRLQHRILNLNYNIGPLF